MVLNSRNPVLIQALNHTKICAFCDSDLDLEDGVMIYDKNWYHNKCWNSFESQKGENTND